MSKGAEAPGHRRSVVVDFRDLPSGGISPDERILGLPVAQRLALAARRAGNGPVHALATESSPAATALRACGIDVSSTPAEIPPPAGHGLMWLAGDCLGEVEWLKAAATLEIGSDQWARPAEGVILVGAARTEIFLEVLRGSGDMAALAATLTEKAGPPTPLALTPQPMRLRDQGDRPVAEQRLMRSLVKDTDGFMARHVDRPISLAISRRLAATPITPNQMTLVATVIGLVSAPFFLSDLAYWQIVGAILFWFHSVVDGCDGELARLKFKESRWGGLLDFWGDNLVHVAVFACMGVGWTWATGSHWPAILGSGAVLGTIAASVIIYFHVMRRATAAGPLYTSVSVAPSRGLTRLLDELSRRDFIYLIVALSLFGAAHWFLLAAGIGTPLFVLLILLIAARDRLAQGSRVSGQQQS
ncbi:MAG: CDP-alcohol phosphatidyltransferase family protein [Alphaproteobacteria bacterium]|nr:CDP-alcohol phosphatidyltransferase family protein [Alphaproteobacteria bacterium]